MTVPGQRVRAPWGRKRVLTPESAARIAIFGGVLMVGLGVLLVRLWFLQVIAGPEYAQIADANRLRTIRTEAPRGAIVDRDRRPLVSNGRSVAVVVRPKDFEDGRNTDVLRRLARVLRVPPTRLIRDVRSSRSSSYETVTLAEDVKGALRLYLAERRRDFPGVRLVETYPREYPEGTTLAHVLGYTGRITPQSIRDYRKQGYLGDEIVGTSGLEAQYEPYLAGKPGTSVIEVDATGEPQGRQVVSSTAPQQGNTLQLGIDLPTQRALDAALRERVLESGSPAGAAGVAMDPTTGEVLAISSFPSYRPEAFSRNRGRAVRGLFADPRKPLLNRAIGGVYPAGSTFKVITAAAALRRDFLQPGDVLDSPGQLTLYKQVFRGFEDRSWGTVDVRRALEVSSDTFFYQLGDRFYRDAADDDALQQEARRFGLGRPTGIDLPGGDDAGVVPDPEWKRRAFRDSPDPLDRTWKPGDSINLSTGQGNLLVTPLQMATAYAAIANGGRVVVPTIGRRIIDASGNPLQSLAPRPSRPISIGPETLAALRDGLLAAANEPDGTSSAVFGGLPDEFTVAGKTGTAENETRVDHSWYVGYAPAQAPRIVVAVVIEQGGQGANAAAPAVCRTMAAYLSFDSGDCGGGASAN